jgi:primosomal protein N'
VARGDYEFFLRREMEQRAELGYPPFCELVKVTATGTQRAMLIERAASAGREAGATVLGPIELAAGERPDEARDLELLMKCRDAQRVAEALRVILAQMPPGRVRVDVDPR